MGETFRKWRRQLEQLGYVVDYRILDASHYGAPTRRRRLFLIARCDGQPIRWPEPTHGPGRRPFRTAAECIDWSLPCPSIFERARPLAEKTLWRIAQGVRRFVLETAKPFIVQVNHGKRDPRVQSTDEPLPTVTAKRNEAARSWCRRSSKRAMANEKARRLACQDSTSHSAPSSPGGQKHALVAAFLARHFGDPLRKSGGGVVLGDDLEKPIATITARDHHSLAAVCLAKFRGTSEAHPGCASADDPLPTVSAGGNHVAEVRAFLTAYYSVDQGQPVDEPLRTITAKHRLGLVTVHGIDYQITDLGLRMLEPHELLRAQFGRFAAGYDLSAGRTKAAKVRLIGNSVCPEVAEALIAANIERGAVRAA